jgi:hypothetical protein
MKSRRRAVLALSLLTMCLTCGADLLERYGGSSPAGRVTASLAFAFALGLISVAVYLSVPTTEPQASPSAS